MSKDLSRDWLRVNKVCKEIRWLSYDPDYKNYDLKAALEILEKLKEELGKKINK